MLSNDLELTLRKALTIASDCKHEYATYEHLLLALSDDKDAKEIFLENGVVLETFKKRLKNYLQHDLAELVDEDVKEAKPTAGFQRIIQSNWCDCDMIENPPRANDGEDEDEEVESLRHENCLLLVTWTCHL